MDAVAQDPPLHKPPPSPVGSDKLGADGPDWAYIPPKPPFHGSSSSPSTPPKLDALPSIPPLDTGSFLPPTPTTPSTPLSPGQFDARPKKSNPLVDLIDTEKHYVDQLAGIIRRVAAAWSRSNLPPPELDIMFRSIEGVYKANRGLLNKLKEIGTNPKALGDLLMRWIDDLEFPYTNYCSKYSSGFAVWEPVASNARLQPILQEFSVKFPPPTSLITNPDIPEWTLDALFLLPKLRLKYYKKLYSRLLKSTVPGRTDYNLLVGALDKLDRLTETQESREKVLVGSDESSHSNAAVLGEDEVVVDLRTQKESAPAPPYPLPQGSIDADVTQSENSSRASSSVMGERVSGETATSSVNRGSSQTMSMPISDLERRLSTERTLDIFSMKPKSVRLQMALPSLTFKRELRLSMDVVISVVPRATGVEVVHRQGHVFLLSDLFLVCERMSPEDRAVGGSEGPDMWLCYPPLAGKVLKASQTSADTLQVSVMRKENLYLQAESPQAFELLFTEFKDCIEFAGSVSISKQPPPPMPPLPPSGSIAPHPQVFQYDGPGSGNVSRTGSVSPPQRTSQSSLHYNGSGPPGPPMSFRSGDNQPRYSGDSDGPPDAYRSPPLLQRGPSLPHAPYLDSPIKPDMPIFFNPGQIIPPSRSTSVATHQSLNGLPLRPSPHSGPAGPGPSGSIMHGGFQGPPGPGPGQPFHHLPGPPHHNGPPGAQFQTYQRLPPGPNGLPPRPPSEPPYQDGPMRKVPSTRSLHSQYEQPHSAPPLPMPALPPNGYGYPNNNFMPPRDPSTNSLIAPSPRALLPSANNSRIASGVDVGQPSFAEPSPPSSPSDAARELPIGPVTSSISAQMKCKVFLKQYHAQWKSLGAAKLKLYVQDPTNIKQLVVEADNKDHSVIISTIVLTDGVERVGKTGVAIELSDKGARTGIVYMIQLRNEKSAGGLFDSLLAGSDRAN